MELPVQLYAEPLALSNVVEGLTVCCSGLKACTMTLNAAVALMLATWLPEHDSMGQHPLLDLAEMRIGAKKQSWWGERP